MVTRCSTSPSSIYLLGAPEFFEAERPIHFDTSKATAVLAYLALSPGRHSRERVSGIIWSDYTQTRAFANLRRTLWSIRTAATPRWIDTQGDSLALADEVWCDARTFRRRLRELSDGDASRPPQELKTELSRLVALYRDDFLSDFADEVSPEFEQWRFFQRDDLRRALAKSLSSLIRLCVEGDEIDEALHYGNRLLAVDHLDESAHRELMYLYASAGRRSAAVRQYEVCRGLLEEEIGVEPEAETTLLFERIVAGDVAPPTTGFSVTPLARETDAESIGALRAAPLVGRDREVRELIDRLDAGECGVVTLSGPGGIGKSRLAFELHTRRPESLRDGAYFISLEHVTSPERFYATLIFELGLVTDKRSDPRMQLIGFLKGKRALLVLDGIGGLGHGVDEFLLDAALSPGLGILVTAREPLELPGECVYDLRALAVPESTVIDEFDRCPSVELFVRCARRARADFAIRDDQREALRRVLTILGGLPLGIELAAPLVRTMSCRELAAELERGLDILTSESAARPRRHRSIRAVFEPAWQALSDEERDALFVLTLFAGDVDMETARTVLGTSSQPLLRLAAQSLVTKGETGSLHLHPLLIRFTREKFQAYPERYHALRRRYGEYYALFVAQRTTSLSGFGQAEAVREIDRELDHILAAWELSLTTREFETIERLLPGMVLFHKLRGRILGAKELFLSTYETLASVSVQSDRNGALVARILLFVAYMSHKLNHKASARRYFGEAEPLLEELNTPDAGFYFAMAAGLGIWSEPSHSRGAYWLGRAEAALLDGGDDFARSFTAHIRGDLARSEFLSEEAERHYRESLVLSRAIGDVWGEGYAVKAIGEVAFAVGDYGRARALYEEALENRRRVGDRDSLAWDTGRLGTIMYVLGDYGKAAALLTESLKMETALGNFGDAVWIAVRLADLETDQDNLTSAARHLSAAEEYITSVESPMIRGRLLLGQGRFALVSGDSAAAMELARRADEHFTASRNLEWRIEAAYVLARSALARGDETEIRACIRAFDDLVTRRGGLPYTVLQGAALKAEFQYDGDIAGALLRAYVVLDHPAGLFITKVEVAKLIERAEGEMSAAQTARVRERARRVTLDELATVSL